MHMCTDETLVYILVRKSYGGMESKPMLAPREIFPLLDAQNRIELMTLQYTGQQAQHTTD